MTQSLKKASEKPSRARFKGILFWFVLAVLFLSFGFFRYFFSSFLTPPLLLNTESLEEPYVISKDGSFVLEFDQRMKKETVEAALKFEPEINYKATWEGRKLYLKPEGALQQNTTYYLSLGKEAQSILGNALIKNYLLKYELGEDPRLVRVFPEGALLRPSEDIIIIFSHAMVGESLIGEKTTPGFLKLEPYLEGDWIWKNSKVLVFRPAKPFPLSTRFHLKSTKSIETYDKAMVKEKIDQTFETERFQRVPNPEQETVVTKISEPLLLAFNQPVEIVNLKKNLSLLNSSGKKVEYISIQKKDVESSYVYEVRSDKNWAYNEEYTLRLSPELMPAVGNLGLGTEASEVFKIEDLLSSDSFLYSNDKSLLEANGVIRINLKENLTTESLKKSIRFLPEMNFEIEKSDDRTVKILLQNVSQIGENMKLFITPEINTGTTVFLLSPLEYIVSDVEPLEIQTAESETILCITSNLPLTAKSYIAYNDASWRLERANEEICSRQSDYIYTFDKKFLPPDEQLVMLLHVEDVFDQKVEKQELIKTAALKSDNVILASNLNNFYSTVKNPGDLKFSYTTSNVSRVNVQVCKLTSDLAVTIEGSYEEKWNSFSPTSEKCQKYKSTFEEIVPDWGRVQNHLVDLIQAFEEVTPGLYYVHVSAPTYFDSDGRALQASAVLNFTSWNIFSKRAESSLVWVTEEGKPVPDVSISLYANDGSFLESGRTDQDGLFFSQKNKVKYEYIVAQKGSQEAMLNVFYQEGFEPNRFSVLSNPEENPYLYQFYLEDVSRNQRALRGVFILKEKEENIPRPPNVKGATVTLYDSEEQLLWRQYENIDDFGNLFFEIYPSHTLLDGKYFLGVCLGLHDGVCHGTFLWTTLYKGFQQEMASSHPVLQEEKTSEHIELPLQKIYTPGEEVTVKLKDLQPNTPALVTAERDGIYWKQILRPEESEAEVKVRITEQMLPETVITVYQPGKGVAVYDMKLLEIKRDHKKLTYQNKNGDKGIWNLPGGESPAELSQITFELYDNKSYKDDVLVRSFYPAQGISIITSSNGTPFAKNSEQNQSYQLYNGEYIPDLISIDGMLRKEPVEQTIEQSFYIIAHDKNGNFGNVIRSGVRNEEKKITIDAATPSFIREGDQLIISLDIGNKFNENKNLQLVSSSNALQFLSGERVFLGLPANGKQAVEVATRMTSGRTGELLPLSFELFEKDILEAELNTEIPIIGTRSWHPPSELLTYETAQGSATIKIPFRDQGQWDTHVMISPTPLSYVLENIHAMLQKETLSFDETIFKRTIEANYSNLMKDSFDEHEVFKGVIEKGNTVENLLHYLSERQKNDGGWSYFPEQTESNPLLSSWIAKSIASLEQLRYEIPEGMRKNITKYLKEQLDERVNSRINQGLSHTEISEQEMFEELQILNALSSFTPSGISYANNWYTAADTMPNHSLVLLLLTLEDYRDAGTSGMNYKIEELTQILKSRQQTIQNQTWLQGNNGTKLASDFLINSWYLEALIRQSSARSDVPSVITWLVKNKYLQSHQSQKDQFSFLQAMASYLRIYQEEMSADEMTIAFANQFNKTFPIVPGKKFQAFFIEETILRSDDTPGELYLDVSTNKAQPLFIELNWKKKETGEKSVYNGITLDLSFDSDDMAKGDKVRGFISIIVPEALQNVVVTQPLITGAKDVTPDLYSHWKVKTLGSDERWYLFPELPAGETRIPFEWQLTQAGIFVTPRIQAHAIDQPETLSSSNTVQLEVKGRK